MILQECIFPIALSFFCIKYLKKEAFMKEYPVILDDISIYRIVYKLSIIYYYMQTCSYQIRFE